MFTKAWRRWAAVVMVAGICLAVVASSGLRAENEKEKEEEEASMPGVIGGLGIAYLFETQQSLGMLGDAKAKGVYDTETATSLVKQTIGLSANVAKQLEALADSEKLEEADAKVVREFAAISLMLKEQGETLEKFWKKSDAKTAKHWDKLREETRKRILAIVGGGEEKADDDKTEKEE